ncbi:MAG: putative baseplate assembly protein [Acidimicrobiales bacterium]
MSLPAPNLDDRTFQQLVDEAKRMVQRRWPEWTGWTDHNVSDPGVTLIETFAFMVEQLLYRLNRVPDRLYVKFLDLLGIELRPPHAATTDVTFWLTAPQSRVVTVPAGVEVATERTDRTEAVVFRTVEELSIVPVRRIAIAVQPAGGALEDRTNALATGRDVALFAEPPQPGDACFVGLSDPAPSCVLDLRIAGSVEGFGINPLRPPRVWEAWTADGWKPCEIERDTTGGFNRPGDVVLHLPADHAASTVSGQRGGWVRCVVAATPPGDNPYRASPRITDLMAFTVGGTTGARHATEVLAEVLGNSEGAPGQTYDLEHRPVVFGGEPEVIEAMQDLEQADGTTAAVVHEWRRVDDFVDAGPTDRVFRIDATAGRIVFGPAVREPEGALRQYGAVPPAGSVLRVRRYLHGGGRVGNVLPGTLRVLKASVPSVARVENRRAATGGVDGETVDAAKARAPLAFRTRDRAVTAEDYEYLALQASRNLARAHCLTPAAEPGVVRLLVVPHVPEQPSPEQLQPDADTLGRVAAELDLRRVLGARVVIEPPVYQGVRIVVFVRPWATANAAELEARVVAAVRRHLHPVHGGPDGTGWPLGRPVTTGELVGAVARLPGVDQVEDLLLFAIDLATGQYAPQPQPRLVPQANGLPYLERCEVRLQGST